MRKHQNPFAWPAAVVLLGLTGCASGAGMFVAGSAGPSDDGWYEDEFYGDDGQPEESGGYLAASGNVLLPGYEAMGRGRGAALGSTGLGAGVNSAVASLRLTPGGGLRAGLGLPTPVGSAAVQARLGAPLSSGPTAVGASTPLGGASLVSGGLAAPTSLTLAPANPVAAVTGAADGLGPLGRPVKSLVASPALAPVVSGVGALTPPTLTASVNPTGGAAPLLAVGGLLKR